MLLYLPFNAQHAPLQTAAEISRSLPRHQGREAADLRRDDVGHGRRRRPVLKTVREKGQEENTLIVFTCRQRRPDAARPPRATCRSAASRRPRSKVASAFRSCCNGRGRSPPGRLRQADHSARRPAHRPGGGGRRDDPSWKLDGVNLLPYLTGKRAKPHESLSGGSTSKRAVRTATGSWSSANRRAAAKALQPRRRHWRSERPVSQAPRESRRVEAAVGRLD